MLRKKIIEINFHPQQNRIITKCQIQGYIEEFGNEIHRHYLMPTIERFEDKRMFKKII